MKRTRLTKDCKYDKNIHIDDDILSMIHFIQNPMQNKPIKKLFSRQYFECTKTDHPDKIARNYKPYYNFCKKQNCCVDICGLCSFNHHSCGNNLFVNSIKDSNNIQKIFNLNEILIL